MTFQPMDGVLIVFVLVCGVTDIFYDKMYNPVTYAAMIAGFLVAGMGYGAHTLAGTPVTLSDAIFGFLVGFVPFFVIYLMRGVGGGDVKLIAAIGTLKGPTFIAFTMTYAIFIGAAYGLIAVGFRGELLPLLKRVGYTLLHTFTPGMGPTSHLDVNGPTIKFGFSICLGTLICLLGQTLGRQLLDL